jgi:membrane-bound serine protease (ClpP class)
MLKVILILIAAYILYEIIEHAVLPLIWLITKRQQRSSTGESGMIGLEAEVREWKDNKGKVFVHGELWRAESDAALAVGDTVRIQKVKGLTLKVEPWQG